MTHEQFIREFSDHNITQPSFDDEIIVPEHDNTEVNEKKNIPIKKRNGRKIITVEKKQQRIQSQSSQPSQSSQSSQPSEKYEPSQPRQPSQSSQPRQPQKPYNQSIQILQTPKNSNASNQSQSSKIIKSNKNGKFNKIKILSAEKEVQESNTNEYTSNEVKNINFETEMKNLIETIYRFVTVNTDYKFQIMVNTTNYETVNKIIHYPSMYNSICHSIPLKDNYKDSVNSIIKLKKDVFIFANNTSIEKNDLKDFYNYTNSAGIVSGNYCDKNNEDTLSLNKNLNMNCINDVDKIKNFVCIKDYESYVTKARLLLSIKNLQHDLIVINPYYKKDHYFMPCDIEFIKYKKGNKITKRFIYAYLNVRKSKKENKYYDNVYMSSGTDNVNFWTNEWYNALCGNINTSYIGDLIKCGYDGVFIDGMENDD